MKAAVAARETEHRAEHEAREDAAYTAIAKTLKRDAGGVEAAFESAGIHFGGRGGHGPGGPGAGEIHVSGATAQKNVTEAEEHTGPSRP